MSDIIVFGAGGRVGRAVVTEAVDRGHRVTAAVRDPGRHLDLTRAGVTVVRGDATDPDSVAATAAGHDAAVHTAARLDTGAEEFFVAGAKAMIAGLARAGVGRLVALGIASALETEPGVRVMDAPDFPEAYRAFTQGHVSEFDTLVAAGGALDWLVIAPPMDLDAAAPPTGRYRTALGRQVDGPGRLAHADLALAVVDEIEKPRHHRVLLAVAD
ncbi:NAD(P)H-binding protein [Streptomyces sp. NBC_01317]|uniref:NAD(P)-dependent oxidoreductase n=1 Tax=Streptomyces sp. NBC_01317 TaxID=2903822 RepID=UPI002E158871|nr:NAD(P)H-binding protein [Streptomyces sp. NBC_01317]